MSVHLHCIHKELLPNTYDVAVYSMDVHIHTEETEALC